MMKIATATILATHLKVTNSMSTKGRPDFSWDTLPVFFHSANASGPWSDAALASIIKFSMATNEKNHAMRLPGGKSRSEEIAGPEACRQIKSASGGRTDTFFYLNPIFDWPTNEHLHGLMVANPSWRLKASNGTDIRQHNQWVYNLSNPDLRKAWVATCTAAVANGCTGCFIDQSNSNIAGDCTAWGCAKKDAKGFSDGHITAIIELSVALAPTGNYAIYNHLGRTGFNTTTMMIEDFAGSEKCITTLQTIAGRGFTAQAHAGLFPAGNTCVDGDTNAMAAFLLGAGNYSYYHCSIGWQTNAKWPAVKDSWLDWLPEYDMPLGAPLGPATSKPSSSPSSDGTSNIWTRSFATGTKVEFDGATNVGVIYWAGGKVQKGVAPAAGAMDHGCRWEDI